MTSLDNKKIFRGMNYIDDEILEEAFEPMKHVKKSNIIWLRRAGQIAGGLAAAFVLMVGLCCAFPALAAGIPGMQSIVAFLKGDARTFDPIVREGAVNEFMQPVPGVSEASISPEAEYPVGMEITETYFDGSALVLGLRVTLDEAPEEYRRLVFQPDLAFDADGTAYTPDYAMEQANVAVLSRYAGNTFIGAVSLYATEDELALPDSFTLTVGMKDLRALDTKLMVLADENDPGSYVMKRYDLPVLTPIACRIHKAADLRKVYPVNETKDGCTLESVVVTPAWTEVNITVDRDTGEEGSQIVMIPYGSDGKQLEYLSLHGTLYGNQRFRPLVKGETEITVKFFQRNNKYEPVAEFTVPVNGGYADPDQKILYAGAVDEDVVYDPAPEPFVDDARAAPLELGEKIDPGFYNTGTVDVGSVRISLDNIQYFDDWQQAGLPTENINLPADLENGRTTLADYTFITFDMTVERFDDPEDAGWGMHLTGPWTFSYLEPGQTIEAYGTAMKYSCDFAYLEGHGRGFSDYYHYSAQPNGTTTLKVGVLAETEKLQAGQAILCARTDDLERPRISGEYTFYPNFYRVYQIPPRS